MYAHPGDPFRGITRVFFALAIVLAMSLAAPGWGRASAQAPPLSVSPSASPAPAPPLYDARAQADHIGRILVPFRVNGQGPFRFVLDTGANRTVLTPRLIEMLGLQVAHDSRVTMSGVTGSASVPTVDVSEVKAGEVVLSRQQLPVADSLSDDVDGILGVDALGDTRVIVDFLANRIQIRKAHREGVMDGMTRVPAKFRFGRLMVVNATIGRIPVKAVIDTGSEYTLANLTLRTRLGFPKGITASSATDVVGETLARQRGERRQVPVLRMGEAIQIARPTVIFGDFYVFHLWDLETEPAIVIGMDMIGSLESFVIDYQRCEIQVRTHGEPFYVR
jgi:predicted aspartyl protease